MLNLYIYRAEGFWQRSRGLIGLKGLEARVSESPAPPNSVECLWIPHCNAVHTCFMQADIDVLFVDSELTMLEFHHSVLPWRFRRRADAAHVFEFASGTLKSKEHCDAIQAQLHRMFARQTESAFAQRFGWAMISHHH